MNRKEYFTNIYNTSYWGGKKSKSGKGSDLEQTITLREELKKLINKLNIKILIDCASGDFLWMSQIINHLNITQYIGLDIVSEMIEQLNLKYSNSIIQFKQCDIVEDFLPKGDLILCRDCLVHLSYKEIKSFLNNFIKSNTPYLLTTTFTKERNYNEAGIGKDHWSPLILWKPPLCLPKPLELINENCTQENNSFNDKSLGLWSRQQIMETICGT